MKRVFKQYPRIVVEADQHGDYDTARFSRIEMFTGALAMQPEVYYEDPTIRAFGTRILNIAALHTALVTNNQIATAFTMTYRQVLTANTNVHKALDVPCGKALAPTFLEKGFCRIERATMKLGLSAEELTLVNEFIAGKTFQQIADARDISRSTIKDRFEDFKVAASVSDMHDLELYLTMSGELHDFGDENTLPAYDRRTPPLSIDQLSPPVDEATLIPFTQSVPEPLTQEQILNYMNKPDAF